MLKSYRNIIFLIIISWLGAIALAELPTEIVKCAAGDKRCIVSIITHVVHTYPKGIPEIGLAAIEAINLENVLVTEAEPNTSSQLNLKFNTLIIRGFENTTILQANGFEKELHRGFELTGVTPRILMNGTYEASGKVLFLPIQGKGQAQVELKDCKFTCKVKAADDRRVEGKQYIKLTKVKCAVEVKGVHVNFENLFNNRELSDSMNELVNSNWQDIWHSMRKGINSAVDQVAKTILGSVLAKLSYDDFYAADKFNK